MYALIETGGQQFKIKQGDFVKVEKLDGVVGDTVELDKVLFVQSDDGVKVGKPYVAGAKVIGEIIEQGRNKKVVVFRYIRRKGYQKKRGHRQAFTGLKIAQIIA
jgi:large subunit ribosomal protein L21